MVTSSQAPISRIYAWHALRHTCASLMRAAGADVEEIQTKLGHRSPMITLSSHTHLFEDALDSSDGSSRH